jgi:hypothetical protein
VLTSTYFFDISDPQLEAEVSPDSPDEQNLEHYISHCEREGLIDAAVLDSWQKTSFSRWKILKDGLKISEYIERFKRLHDPQGFQLVSYDFGAE